MDFKLASKITCQRYFFKAAVGLALVLGSTAGCAHIGPGNSYVLFRENTLNHELEKAAAFSTIIPLDRAALAKEFDRLEQRSTATDDKTFNEEEASRKIIADAIKSAANKHRIPHQKVEEIIRKIDEDPVTSTMAIAHGQSNSASATPIKGMHAALVMVDNPDKPFRPTSFEEHLIENMTGIHGIDKALGQSYAEKIRIVLLLHEYNHCGDKKIGALLEELSTCLVNEDFGGEKLGKMVLDSEIQADFPAFRTFHKLFGDVDFIRHIAYARMLESIRSDECHHATQFELGRLVNEFDPDGPKIPIVPRDQIENAFLGLMDETIPSIIVPEEISSAIPADQSWFMKHRIAAIRIGLKDDLIKDPWQKEMAKLTIMAFDHFQNKINSSTPRLPFQKNPVSVKNLSPPKP